MLLDTDFFNKPEVLQLTARFGDSGPMAILRICAALMNERDASLDADSINALYLGSACNAEKWVQIVAFLLKINWLSEVDGKITSKRVAEERARVEQKRATLSANAKQMPSKCSANAEQKQSISSDTDTDTDHKDLDPKKQSATYTKTWKGKRLWLDGEDYASLQVNHYHGDDKKLLADLPFFDDLATKKNMNFASSEQCAAQIRYYIGQKAVFKKDEPKKDNRPRPKVFVPVWEREKQEGAK